MTCVRHAFSTVRRRGGLSTAGAEPGPAAGGGDHSDIQTHSATENHSDTQTRRFPAPPSTGGPMSETVEPTVEPSAERPAPEPVAPHDAGMATAEYAIATLAACGFAGLLVAILRSDEVRGMLLGIIQRALGMA